MVSGTAGRVRQMLPHLRELAFDTPQFVGDHLLRMDYRNFPKTAFDTGADPTAR
ncbi:MAG: hypothetical protein IPK98_19815 [Chloracidobacterium sp.]|nr:hypothetical protein [Chloracidobacterium sp.]